MQMNNYEREIAEREQRVRDEFEKGLAKVKTAGLDDEFADFAEKFKDFVNVDEKLSSEDRELTLEEAVLDFQQGDERAFEYIFNHYERPITNLSRRMHNDELSSELYEVLLRAAKRFDLTYRAKFNTYFWRCAQNHIGSQRNMREAQKRGGVKGKTHIDPTVKLDVEEQREFYKQEEQKPRIKTLSLNATLSSNQDYDSEIMAFLEDEATQGSFDDTTLKVDLENLLSSGSLKPKEAAAIRLIWENRNITLEEAGQKLGNITAPAVHVLLRRIGKKPVANQLREILAR